MILTNSSHCANVMMQLNSSLIVNFFFSGWSLFEFILFYITNYSS